MKFKKGQMVKLNPKFVRDGETLAGLIDGKAYSVYGFIPGTNQVMFMGVTEQYVNANLLVPARKSKKSKRR